MANTIMLNEHFVEENRHVAEVAITPGELVDYNADPKRDIIPHATAGDKAAAWFAMENELAGEGIEVDYAVGDQVKVGMAQAGCKVFAFLDFSSLATVQGSFLESAGNGNLRVHVPQVEGGTGSIDPIRVGQIIAKAEQIIASPATGRSRIEIRVL